MDTWKLEDGTTVALGGTVVGNSMVADCLRLILSRAESEHVSSGYGCQPHIEALDVNVPHLLDYWLRDSFEVVSGPAVAYPEAVPRPSPPPGAVY